MLSFAVVGSPATVQARLAQIIKDTAADELMVVTSIFEHAARLRSYEMLAEVQKNLNAA
jgi:alkanesulfonate monooxygenase SsuD/methylene tetrahydromethanopterin reductase-like flavin-dependent oxidoreductase (luciferase family)